jgi:hypothetical protein
VATYTVGDDVKPALVVAEERVFVDLALATDIRTSDRSELHPSRSYHGDVLARLLRSSCE